MQGRVICKVVLDARSCYMLGRVICQVVLYARSCYMPGRIYAMLYYMQEFMVDGMMIIEGANSSGLNALSHSPL